MINEVPLENMNLSERCEGCVTRVKRKNPTEKSAIDFVLACQEAESLFERIEIDEEGKYLMRSDKAASDHNSILLYLDLKNIDHHRVAQIPKWKTQVSEEQNDALICELQKFQSESKQIMTDATRTMDDRNDRWFNSLERILSTTVGKRTNTCAKPERFSEQVK